MQYSEYPVDRIYESWRRIKVIKAAVAENEAASRQRLGVKLRVDRAPDASVSHRRMIRHWPGALQNSGLYSSKREIHP